MRMQPIYGTLREMNMRFLDLELSSRLSRLGGAAVLIFVLASCDSDSNNGQQAENELTWDQSNWDEAEWQ